MRAVDDILKKAKLLGVRERKKLLSALRAIDRSPPAGKRAKRKPATSAKSTAALEAFLKLAGTVHSDFTDVATDKHKHLAEIYADRHSK